VKHEEGAGTNDDTHIAQLVVYAGEPMLGDFSTRGEVSMDP